MEMQAFNCRRLIPSFFLFVLLGFILASVVQAQSAFSGASPWEGRKIFNEIGCIQCHAVYKKGGEGGPDLGQNKFSGTYIDLAALMWNHFPGMVKKMDKLDFSFPEINVQQMGQLVSYLAHIRYIGEDGNVFRGRKLLKSKKCTFCHKFGGKGGDIGPDISEIKDYISPLLLVESMWNHGPKLKETFDEHNIKWPHFRKNEMIDLAAGIRSYMNVKNVPIDAFAMGNANRGEKVIKEKGCMKCHTLHGEGAGKGTDFDKLELSYSLTEIAGKMWNHGPKMWSKMRKENIPFPTFKRGEMSDVIAYIYECKLTDAPGDQILGAKLVETRGCLGCHSIANKGADISSDLGDLPDLISPLHLITAMWNHAPAMQERHREEQKKWPHFTGRDMANLYAYLQTLPLETIK